MRRTNISQIVDHVQTMCRSYMTLTSESRKVVHRASSGTRLILCAHSSSTLTIFVAAEIPSLLAMFPSQMNDEGMAMSGTVLMISVVLEGVFLLTFLTIHSIGARIFFRCISVSERLRKPSAFPFLAGTAMLLLAFAHFFLSVYVSCNRYSGEVEQGRTPLWYVSVSNAKFVIYVSQTLLGDGFMVYRLYVVWGRRWPVLVFPAILLICDILLGYSLPWLPIVPTPDFFATSVFTNVLCTVLILWRVLQLTFGPHSSLVIQRVIEGIVQSAAVYSAASIALVIMVLKSPDVGYVVCLNVFPALIGLVFSFIVVRTGLKSRDDDASNDSRTMQSQRMTTSTSPPSTIHHEQSPWHTPFVNDPTVPGDRLVAHPGATWTESIVPGQYNVGSPAFPFYMAAAPNAEQS